MANPTRQLINMFDNYWELIDIEFLDKIPGWIIVGFVLIGIVGALMFIPVLFLLTSVIILALGGIALVIASPLFLAAGFLVVMSFFTPGAFEAIMDFLWLIMYTAFGLPWNFLFRSIRYMF